MKEEPAMNSLDNPDNRESLIRDLNAAYGLALTASISPEELENLLADTLNTLIRDDFHSLVGLLYRIDVNESRLRHLLQANPGTDAGKIIARLIIDRQLQKIESRKKYRRHAADGDGQPNNDGGEEKW